MKPRHGRRKKAPPVPSMLDTHGGAIQALEDEHVRAGDKLMTTYGFESIHFSQARASNQTEGISDRLYLHEERGVAVWWEAKKTGGVQSSHQKKFQRLVTACGWAYVVGTFDVLAAWVRTEFIGKDKQRG